MSAGLDADAGATLAATARDAFSSGAHAAYLTSAVLALLAAFGAWLVLGRDETADERIDEAVT